MTTEIPDSVSSGAVAEATPPDEDRSDHTGLLVDGRYQILELIGRGGMGSVYKAEHKGIGRFVALKLLHPSLAMLPEVAKRFEREALAIGRIEHPNCVDVSDSGKIDDGSLFLVMEFLEGQSVGDLLADEGHVQPERALRIMRHMLCGLAHAHQASIVHRDIKPENIFLVTQDDDRDFAKILDFGIAKLVGSTEKDNIKLTQAGVAFGTPAYMSPEQAVGNPVDGRADLYAATVVLYELLTGVAPFRSDDKLEVLSMHTTRPPPAFSESAPELAIPAIVETLVMRGLAKRPDDRFVDADAYIAALDTVLRQLMAPRVALRLPKRSQTVPVLYSLPASAAQRAATELPEPTQPPRRLGRGAAIAAGIIGLALLIAFAVTRGDDASTEMSSVALPARSLAERAGDFLTADKPEEAIALLEGEARAVADDSMAQRELGHAYLAVDRGRDALRAFERALTLESTAIADPTVRKDLRTLLDPEEPDVAMDAADIILVRVRDEEAATRLAELASTTPDQAARARARGLADKHGVMAKVDLVESFALDLVQGERCTDRLEIVRKLRDLGDQRAIPHLKKARHRRSSNPKYRGQNINGCLTDAATAAIKHLESRAK